MTSPSLQSKVKPANGSAPGAAPHAPTRSGAEGLPSFTQSTLESLIEKQECAPCGSFWQAIGNFFSAIFNWFIGLFTSSQTPPKDQEVKEERKDEVKAEGVVPQTSTHASSEPASTSGAVVAEGAAVASEPARTSAGESAPAAAPKQESAPPQKPLSVMVPSSSKEDLTTQDFEPVFHDDETPPSETKSSGAGSAAPLTAREFVDKWKTTKRVLRTAEFYADFKRLPEPVQNTIEKWLAITMPQGSILQKMSTTPRQATTPRSATPRGKIEELIKTSPLSDQDMLDLEKLLFG